MPTRSSKRKHLDLNQLAASIVGEATELEPTEALPAETTPEPTAEERHAAAVALGRLGGKKGGAARAKSLTADQRREIAKKAAAARWRKSSPPTPGPQ